MKKLNSQDILFIKLETIPEALKFELLDKYKQLFWEDKAHYYWKNDSLSNSYSRKAALWAEFGKISIISTGLIKYIDQSKRLVINTFTGDESEILLNFKAYLNKYFNKPFHRFCAHNGKEFTYPFMCRRYLVNNIEIPSKLSVFDKKPWEIIHLDTMEMWKFGMYKHNISLGLLSHILKVSNTFENSSGYSTVNESSIPFKTRNDKWKLYERDLFTLVNVFLRFMNETVLQQDQILYDDHID